MIYRRENRGFALVLAIGLALGNIHCGGGSGKTCTGSQGAAVPCGGFELPRPTGSYAIGSELRALVDSTRTEPASPNPTDKRKIAVQLFYPADPCPACAPTALMTRAEARFEALIAPLPATGYVTGTWPPDQPWEQLVVMHAQSNAPLAAAGGSFPVVIFSHGLGLLRDMYVSYLEDLASWGFVVAAISHTYDSGVVVFPDGSEVDSNFYWVADPNSGITDAELDSHIAVWLADARFVADQLTAWNASDPGDRLTGRLDLERLGMFGHSYGGATSAEACFADARFKAGANFDGTLYSPARSTGGRAVNQPFLLQLSDSGPDQSIDDFFGKLEVGYQVTLSNTSHYYFSDLPLEGQQLYGDSFGPGNYLRTLIVSRAYTLAFFKKHLLGEPQPLLDGPSPDFPEATFKKKP